jgi:hypothetical protein
MFTATADQAEDNWLQIVCGGAKFKIARKGKENDVQTIFYNDYFTM